MSIFGAIKKAIFGDSGPLGGQFSGKPAPTPQAAPSPAQKAPVPGSAPAAPTSAPAATPAAAPVDVEKVLAELEKMHDGPALNWRSSIVDLMKLLGIDSSLANRKELATELGYSGDKDGSAEMNIWLHKAVMRELEKNGGVVPAGLKD